MVPLEDKKKEKPKIRGEHGGINVTFLMLWLQAPKPEALQMWKTRMAGPLL